MSIYSSPVRDPAERRVVAALSLQTDAITVVPRRGPDLRFAITGHSWPSPGRAEICGVGVVPADQQTRTILAAFGCR
ncbi:hypothetical protein [Amycolatopsis tolypomycina]|uniref:hypothetical protein n=1 Tax=Amycolatopsis tolypomycina TaxID=208445 RepID=UPI0033B732BB